MYVHAHATAEVGGMRGGGGGGQVQVANFVVLRHFKGIVHRVVLCGSYSALHLLSPPGCLSVWVSVCLE